VRGAAAPAARPARAAPRMRPEAADPAPRATAPQRILAQADAAGAGASGTDARRASGLVQGAEGPCRSSGAAAPCPGIAAHGAWDSAGSRARSRGAAHEEAIPVGVVVAASGPAAGPPPPPAAEREPPPPLDRAWLAACSAAAAGDADTLRSFLAGPGGGAAARARRATAAEAAALGPAAGPDAPVQARDALVDIALRAGHEAALAGTPGADPVLRAGLWPRAPCLPPPPPY
jgi:hypothetical protein